MAEALLSASRDMINVMNTAAGSEEQTETSYPVSPSTIFAVNDDGVSFPLTMDSLPQKPIDHVISKDDEWRHGEAEV